MHYYSFDPFFFLLFLLFSWQLITFFFCNITWLCFSIIVFFCLLNAMKTMIFVLFFKSSSNRKENVTSSGTIRWKSSFWNNVGEEKPQWLPVFFFPLLLFKYYYSNGGRFLSRYLSLSCTPYQLSHMCLIAKTGGLVLFFKLVRLLITLNSNINFVIMLFVSISIELSITQTHGYPYRTPSPWSNKCYITSIVINANL